MVRQPLQCATWHCGHVAKVLSISDDRTFGSTQHLQCARRLGTTSTSFFLLARGLRRRGSPPSGRKAPVECFPPDPVPHNEAGSVLWNLVRTRQLHHGTMPSRSRSNIGIRSRPPQQLPTAQSPPRGLHSTKSFHFRRQTPAVAV